MSTSTELFKGRAFDIFDAGEINEVLLAIYRELSFAIRDSSDTMILSRNELVHMNNGRTIGEMPIVYGSTSIYDMARESILKILERDELVQQFFQIDQMDEDNITVRARAKNTLSPRTGT